jgi:hypothetical protein
MNSEDLLEYKFAFITENLGICQLQLNTNLKQKLRMSNKNVEYFVEWF